jgi:hypothetical protein
MWKEENILTFLPVCGNKIDGRKTKSHNMAGNEQFLLMCSISSLFPCPVANISK